MMKKCFGRRYFFCFLISIISLRVYIFVTSEFRDHGLSEEKVPLFRRFNQDDAPRIKHKPSDYPETEERPMTSQDYVEGKRSEDCCREAENKQTKVMEVPHDDKPRNGNVSECPVKWKEVNGVKATSRSGTSLITLRHDHFLLPVLVNGPNNQLAGLRESVYLSIKLNRTLVIPVFEKHRSDRQLYRDGQIEARHRVDVEYLCKLLPCVTVDRFRDVCESKVNAVFRTRKITVPKYRGIEGALQMKVLKRDDAGKIDKGNPYGDVVEYPLNVQLDKKLRYFTIKPDADVIKKHYPGQERCVLFATPFRNLKIELNPPRGNEKDLSDPNKLSNEELFSEVIRFTRTPRHIVEIAERFVGEFMQSRPYLSVHWRFDKEDWMRRCLAPVSWGQKARQALCRHVLAFQPIDIARTIASRTRNVSYDVKIRDVYVAFPLVEKKHMDDAISLLRNKYELNVFTQTDVEQFWKSHFSTCYWLWKDHDDILSSVEMEICARGKSFLRSRQSTWSGNVVLNRRSRGGDSYDEIHEGIIQYVKVAQAEREGNITRS